LLVDRYNLALTQLEMKKKQIVVVKKIEKPSPKKGLLVSRKVNSDDGFGFDVEKSLVGNSSPQVY
jgi:hypothetical protein